MLIRHFGSSVFIFAKSVYQMEILGSAEQQLHDFIRAHALRKRSLVYFALCLIFHTIHINILYPTHLSQQSSSTTLMQHISSNRFHSPCLTQHLSHPYASSNTLHPPHLNQHPSSNMAHPACITASFNMPHITCFSQHDLFNMSHQHSASNTLHSTCFLQHTASNMPHTARFIQNSSSHMYHVSSNTIHPTDSVQFNVKCIMLSQWKLSQSTLIEMYTILFKSIKPPLCYILLGITDSRYSALLHHEQTC